MSEWQTLIVEIQPDELDRYGLTASIRKAILQIVRALPTEKGIMLDGTYNFLRDTKYAEITRCEPKADGRYQAVMAASVIAKHYRDTVMKQFAAVYPCYGFDTNVGYGTPYHLDAIRRYRSCPIHRKSYAPIKNFKEGH